MAISAHQAIEILRAAGEASRLRILALLAKGELAVMELSHILDQSQPRVSRHLKLLAEAGLVERFPDGAWVFYRLTAAGQAAELVAETLARIDPRDGVLARDADQLTQVRTERAADAAEYFARNHVAEAGLERCELRHGDIFGTRLPDASADLVVVHQVLHYLADPAAAVREAGRIVAGDGKLIIVDFAPHGLEFLREQHQHRRLGFSDAEMKRWLGEAGFPSVQVRALPPAQKEGLTVKIWTAERGRDRQRSAA